MSLDPVSALILAEAGELAGRRVLVVDDAGGEMTRAALEAGADVRAWCDDLRDQLAVPAAHRLTGAVPADLSPDVILWRLPRALSAVEDYAEHLAGVATTDTRVLAGARTKHMTPAQNDMLSRHFTEVSASLGRQKSRVLRASGARAAPRRWPMRRYVPEVGLTVVAHGNVFSTNRLDDGTRLLLRTLGRALPAPDVFRGLGAQGQTIDLGSGSGILAAWLARRGHPVTAMDVSTAACVSTRLTAGANGVDVVVRRRIGLHGVDERSVALVVSNPPFHQGAAKDSQPTIEMIGQAAAALAPGGQLWLVFNSHLPYLDVLRRDVGPTTVEAQDRFYHVTRSVRAA